MQKILHCVSKVWSVIKYIYFLFTGVRPATDGKKGENVIQNFRLFAAYKNKEQ